MSDRKKRVTDFIFSNEDVLRQLKESKAEREANNNCDNKDDVEELEKLLESVQNKQRGEIAKNSRVRVREYIEENKTAFYAKMLLEEELILSEEEIYKAVHLIIDDANYNAYVDSLQLHLFEDLSIEDIIKSCSGNYQARRFMALYIIKNSNIFHAYYDRREELALEGIYNRVLTSLFSKRFKLVYAYGFCDERIRITGATEDMISGEVSEFDMKEVNKDWSSYVAHVLRPIRREHLNNKNGEIDT